MTDFNQAQQVHYKVKPSDENKRLDHFLVEQGRDFSRSQWKKLIDSLHVRINNKAAQAGTKLKANDEIVVVIPSKPSSELIPEARPLQIIHEDESILIINKPAGLVVHPATSHQVGTLVHALLYHDPALAEVGSPDRPGLVHRLDKGTSGLMVIARTEEARRSLIRQFEQRRVYKEYWALVHGVLSPAQGTFATRLGRHPKHRKKFAAVPSGKAAHTDYVVTESFGGLFSVVRLQLHTGRTHQIRVHLSEAGHPILGDKTYGGKRDTRKSLPESVRDAIKALNRPALHSAVLGFQHPTTGKAVKFKAPLPEDLKSIVSCLNQNF